MTRSSILTTTRRSKPPSMHNASMNDLLGRSRNNRVSSNHLIMPASFLLAILLNAFLCVANARESQTALDALKLLPKGMGKNLARIEAREGTPVPERWHILVHDAQSENGLREFVVADGKLVADRTLSQFAEKLTDDDI